MTDHQAGRRGTVLLAVCAASAALSLGAMGATLIYRARSSDEFKRQTVSQCKAIESVKSAIRLVFSDQLAAIQRRRGTIDDTQYRIAHDYYERQLERFKPTSC